MALTREILEETGGAGSNERHKAFGNRKGKNDPRTTSETLASVIQCGFPTTPSCSNLHVYYFKDACKLSRTCGGTHPLAWRKPPDNCTLAYLQFDLRLSDILFITTAACNLLCFGYLRSDSIWAEIFKRKPFHRVDAQL